MLQRVGPEVTIYNATATRAGKYWNVTFQGLPDGMAASAQGATWPEAENNTMDRVQALFPPEQQSWVGVRLIPADPQAADALTGVWTARGNRARAEQAEHDAVAHAIRTMLNQGWSTRDVRGISRAPPACRAYWRLGHQRGLRLGHLGLRGTSPGRCRHGRARVGAEIYTTHAVCVVWLSYRNSGEAGTRFMGVWCV